MHVCDRSLATADRARHDGDVDLDPAHLRSFVAIVDYGGYHRAAEALLLGEPFMAEAALALCSSEPKMLTGRVTFSQPLLAELQRRPPVRH